MRIFSLAVLLILVGFYTINEMINAQTNSKIHIAETKPHKPTKSILSKSTKSKQIKQKEIPVEKRLEFYFYGRKITPLYVVNNLYDFGYENRLKPAKYTILNHTFEWLSDEKEVKFKIDDELISLKDKYNLNNSSYNSSEQKEKIYADIWTQIKFYKFEKDDYIGERELIGIEFGPSICTGLMCSVTNYLVYDFKTKSKNFFGGFRRSIDYDLYYFNKESEKNTIDFVSTSFDGLHADSKIPDIETFNIYSMNEKGVFKELKNSKGEVFYLKKLLFNEELNKPDKLIQNWIEKIR